MGNERGSRAAPECEACCRTQLQWNDFHMQQQCSCDKPCIFMVTHHHSISKCELCGKAAMKHRNRLLPHQSPKWKMSLFSCLSAVSEISPSRNSVAGSVAVAHLTAVWALNKYLPTVKHKHPPPKKQKTSVLIVTHLCVSTGSPGYPVPSSAAAVLTGLTDALHSSKCPQML